MMVVDSRQTSRVGRYASAASCRPAAEAVESIMVEAAGVDATWLISSSFALIVPFLDFNHFLYRESSLMNGRPEEDRYALENTYRQRLESETFGCVTNVLTTRLGQTSRYF
jgi:hypothetical protein